MNIYIYMMYYYLLNSKLHNDSIIISIIIK